MESNEQIPDTQDPVNYKRPLTPHSLVMQEMRDAVMIVDSDGIIRDLNPATEKILGWPRDELIGLHVNDVYQMAKVADLTVGEIGDGVAKSGFWQGEFSFVHRDGGTIRAEATSYPFADEKTGEMGRVTIIRDVTESKEVQRALETSQAAIDSSLSAICLGDLDGNLTYVNDSFVQMWGFRDESELLGNPAADLWIDPVGAARNLSELGELGTWTGENRGRRADGREIDVRLAANIVRDEKSGEPLAWMASLQDITQQKETERALQLTQHAVDTSILSTALIDVEGKFTYVNDAFLKLWGYENASEVIGRSSLEHFEDQEWARGEMQNLAVAGTWAGEGVGRRPNGSKFDLDIFASIVGDEKTGEPIAYLLTGQDVTERNRATEALRIAQFAIDSSLDAIALSDTTGKLNYVNDAYVELFGYTDSSEVLGLDSSDFWTDEKDLEAVVRELQEKGVYSGETVGKRRDGTKVDVQLWANVITDEKTSEPLAWMASLQDVTERNRLIHELRSSEATLRDSEMMTSRIMENAAVGIITIDEKGIIQSFNPMAERLFGYDAEEAIGQNVKMLMPEPYGNEHDFYIENYQETGVAHVLGVAARELVGLHKNGHEFPMELSAAEMWLNDKRTYIGCAIDVTDRREAQEQLQQAQKMEAVGLLTGGVAHDFNNLLAVILGNLELIQEKLPADSDLRKMLAAAFGASTRGADLTGRLLAFSRRQTLQPQSTDVNALTEHMLGLAQRTLGAAVEIVFEPGEDAWRVHVDPGQLENALLNLAINARDAMPNGGTLTIRTKNISSSDKSISTSETLSDGEYVLVEVTDTGTGMSEDTLGKVFEPFFTTKEVGEGSGLGLSMVYGFVNQSGGDVVIKSALDEGTTISLYLPRAKQAHQDAPEALPPTLDLGSSDKIVLVVEDDPHMREVTVSMVKSLGHLVLEAADAASALDVIANNDRVDLLLSDVILGKGMNGVELAKQVGQSNPDTAVLLMSGYAREAFASDNGLGDSYELIAKPFRMADLGRQVGSLLR